MKEMKNNPWSSMTQFLKFPVETRQEFRRFWKERMQPDLTQLIGPDWKQNLSEWRAQPVPAAPGGVVLDRFPLFRSCSPSRTGVPCGSCGRAFVGRFDTPGSRLSSRRREPCRSPAARQRLRHYVGLFRKTAACFAGDCHTIAEQHATLAGPSGLAAVDPATGGRAVLFLGVGLALIPLPEEISDASWEGHAPSWPWTRRRVPPWVAGKVRLGRIIIMLAISLSASVHAGDSASGEEYAFDGKISREVLENYLARSLHMLGLADSKQFHEDLRMIKNVGAKQIGRVAGIWWAADVKVGIEAHFARAKTVAERLHKMDPELMLQACIFETGR